MSQLSTQLYQSSLSTRISSEKKDEYRKIARCRKIAQHMQNSINNLYSTLKTILLYRCEKTKVVKLMRTICIYQTQTKVGRSILILYRIRFLKQRTYFNIKFLCHLSSCCCWHCSDYCCCLSYYLLIRSTSCLYWNCNDCSTANTAPKKSIVT